MLFMLNAIYSGYNFTPLTINTITRTMSYVYFVILTLIVSQHPLFFFSATASIVIILFDLNFYFLIPLKRIFLPFSVLKLLTYNFCLAFTTCIYPVCIWHAKNCLTLKKLNFSEISRVRERKIKNSDLHIFFNRKRFTMKINILLFETFF